jgi:hypothetical protein
MIYTYMFIFQKFYLLLIQYFYVFWTVLRTNKDYFPARRQRIGFYNEKAMCLLCGRK